MFFNPNFFCAANSHLIIELTICICMLLHFVISFETFSINVFQHVHHLHNLKRICYNLTLVELTIKHSFFLSLMHKRCKKQFEWRFECKKQFKELISSRNLLTWPFINLFSYISSQNELHLNILFSCVKFKLLIEGISLQENLSLE